MDCGGFEGFGRFEPWEMPVVSIFLPPDRRLVLQGPVPNSPFIFALYLPYICRGIPRTPRWHAKSRLRPTAILPACQRLLMCATAHKKKKPRVFGQQTPCAGLPSIGSELSPCLWRICGNHGTSPGSASSATVMWGGAQIGRKRRHQYCGVSPRRFDISLQ